MRDFGIVVDSTTNLNFRDKIFKDASFVSLSFIIGNQSYKIEDSRSETIFNGVKHQQIKMLAPTTESFIQAFKEQKALGYDHVLCLISTRYFVDSLSIGKLAKDILKDEHIHLIDTKTFGPGIHYLLEFIDYYSRQNYRISEIIKKMHEKIEHSKLLLSAESLKYFPKIHHVSKFKLFLMKILPHRFILSFENDAFKCVRFVFKKDGVINYFKAFMKNSGEFNISPYVKIMYVESIKDAKELQHEIYQITKNTPAIYGPIPWMIAHPLGKSAIGIFVGSNEV